MAKCKGCGADVFFAVYAKTGNTMIVDAKPQQRLVVVDTPASIEGDAMIRMELRKTYVDHHATCTNWPK